MLACLQGTFCCKPRVATALHGLLEKKPFVGISLAPSGRSNQPLRLQVSLNKSAFNDCGASGELVPVLS